MTSLLNGPENRTQYSSYIANLFNILWRIDGHILILNLYCRLLAGKNLFRLNALTFLYKSIILSIVLIGAMLGRCANTKHFFPPRKTRLQNYTLPKIGFL